MPACVQRKPIVSTRWLLGHSGTIDYDRKRREWPPKPTSRDVRCLVAVGGKADIRLDL
jgi:hypothetical protein